MNSIFPVWCLIFYNSRPVSKPFMCAQSISHFCSAGLRHEAVEATLLRFIPADFDFFKGAVWLSLYLHSSQWPRRWFCINIISSIFYGWYFSSFFTGLLFLFLLFHRTDGIIWFLLCNSVSSDGKIEQIVAVATSPPILSRQYANVIRNWLCNFTLELGLHNENTTKNWGEFHGNHIYNLFVL